jgi:acetyl-CoA synthetase
MDAYYRGGQLLDHREKADIAVSEAEKEGMRVEKILVWQRHPRHVFQPNAIGCRPRLRDE